MPASKASPPIASRVPGALAVTDQWPHGVLLLVNRTCLLKRRDALPHRAALASRDRLGTPDKPAHRLPRLRGKASRTRQKPHLHARTSVPHSMRSLKPAEMADAENALPASRAKPGAERHVVASSTLARNASASWPSGIMIAVSEPLYSAGLRHSIRAPMPRTARRVASAWRWWRANTLASPPRAASSIASCSP